MALPEVKALLRVQPKRDHMGSEPSIPNHVRTIVSMARLSVDSSGEMSTDTLFRTQGCLSFAPRSHRRTSLTLV